MLKFYTFPSKSQKNINLMMPLLLISLIFLTLAFFLLKTNARKSGHPPSPARLPIIGNLHQLGTFPHRSLHALSLKHGPLMLLHLGATPHYVVSSAEMAQEVMKIHDEVFSDRPSSIISDRFSYAGKDVAFAQYGEYWRKVKKINVLQLLSAKRVELFRYVREEEVELMIKAISKSPTSINLSESIISTTNNIVSRVALGKKYIDEKERSGKGFRQLCAEALDLLGVFHIGDLFPSLAWVAYLMGLDARVKNTFKEWENFMDQVIEDHLIIRREKDYRGGDDFVHILLDIEENGEMGVLLDKECIKALLMDNFIAGTDTTYTLMNWTMAELIRHPNAMKKVQDEVRKLVKGRSKVTEDDLHEMQYLKATIKETARLHPPLPLLVPRQTTRNVKLQGYQIPAKSKVIVNAWAIGRDPKWWEDPEEFRPERFMNKSIDFTGQHYQFIPFGAGRRSCPGIPFSIAMIELGLANLLNGFEWHLPGGVRGEEIDMSETFGITVHKTFPLIVSARPYF